MAVCRSRIDLSSGWCAPEGSQSILLSYNFRHGLMVLLGVHWTAVKLGLAGCNPTGNWHYWVVPAIRNIRIQHL